MAALSNENVGWLNVSVNDALAMRRIERVGDLRAQVQNQFGFQRLAHDAVLQGHAIEELHNPKDTAIFFTYIVDRADVGMI